MSDKKLAFWLFLFVGSIYALASSGRARTPDEYMAIFQAESLIDRGSTAVPQSLQANDFYGTYDLKHQPRSPYPPGQAILAVPYEWFARKVIARLPGVAHDRTTVFYVEGFGATLSSATFAAAAMGVFFLFLRRLQLSPREALWLTIYVAFGTYLFPYSGYFFSEAISALLFLLAAFALFGSGHPLTPKRATVAGLILGFSLWVRPTMVLAAGIFGLATIIGDWRKRWKHAFLVLLFPGLSGLGYLVRNKLLFGRALEFGYPDVAELGKQLNTFHTPFYLGLTGFLLSPGKSVFLYCPLLILAIYGMGKLWKIERGLTTICCGLPLVYLLFYMRYTQWEGGFCPGPRYLLPSVIVCCLGLAPSVSTRSPRLKQTVLALACIGFAVQIITYSTSFFEDQAAGNYYDGFFNYRMAYNPMVTQTERLVAYIGGKSAPLGMGFDRWFVFLSKLGVSRGTLAVIAIPPLILAIWSCLVLRRAWIGADKVSSVAAPISG